MRAPDWPSPNPLPLEPSIEQWTELTRLVEGFLADELSQLGKKPVLSQSDPILSQNDEDELMSSLPLSEWLGHLVNSGFNTAHPGFLAFIPGGGLVTSALADWIVKTTNRYGTAHFASPLLTELEHRVIKTFAAWVGYDDNAAGVLTTGGSLANFTAVVTARRTKLPEDFLSGVLYCSNQTHHSVMKAANLAGFSTRNIRILASDEQFKIVPSQLKKQISEDRRAGLQPFMVIASAGTTNTGSIDPLVELGDISRDEDLWYHVDGAYGGAFILTPAGKHLLKGIETADSITLDPHKGLFLPYGTGCILVKDRNKLISAHEMRGDYMPDLDRERAHLDPLSMSVELSREHRGLKIALPLILHGVQAFADALAEKLELSQVLYEALINIPELEVLNKPELTTIAFRMTGKKDAENKALMDAINAGGKVYLSGTVLNEEFALRVSILSHRTHAAEIESVISELQRCLHRSPD
ncbi:MAG: aromatic-L-amino-acid decarboxylase [Candidatus Azotimanducaceae bacterium]|jgi:aromatic-L-amino-acid decarboxylase